MTQLYDLAVPTFTQTLRATEGILEKAEAYFLDSGLNPDDAVTARLMDGMAPLHFQIEALRNHSVWGLDAVKTGVFAPPPLVGVMPFADLRAMLGQATASLEGLTPDEVNSWSRKNFDIDLFQPRDEANPNTSDWTPRTLALTTETFLLSYSIPNFYFHAVTAYNILRSQGVPLGKRDYQGQLRTSSS